VELEAVHPAEAATAAAAVNTERTVGSATMAVETEVQTAAATATSLRDRLHRG
jgi:hypothetical protein